MLKLLSVRNRIYSSLVNGQTSAIPGRLLLGLGLWLLPGINLFAQQPVNPNAKTKSVTPHIISPSVKPKTQFTPAESQVNQPTNAPSKLISLKWTKPLEIKYTEDGAVVEHLHFTGANYEPKRHGLPVYSRRYPLSGGFARVTVTLVNPVYEPVTEREAALLRERHDIINDFEINSTDEKIRGEPYAYITIVPLRKQSAGNGYEKLVSFTLDIKPVSEPTVRKISTHRATGFASNSVLATGTWYKIGVTADGIYKLDYSFFKRMGLDMSTLLPSNIRIFGNGGHMLPVDNDSARIDDLAENAIYVNGQSDPAFSSSDYVLFYGQGPTKWAYSSSDKLYHHTVNLYADTSYYFITIGPGTGKRVAAATLFGGIPNDTVTTFDDYAYHEQDATNLIQSGSAWMGEYFSSTTSYSFSFFFPNIVSSSQANVTACVASRYIDSSHYSVSAFSTTATIGAPGVATNCYYCEYASWGKGVCSFLPTSSSVNVTVTKLTPGAVGWLYYLEANARRQLNLSSGQMAFRDAKSVGSGIASLFKVSTLQPQMTVWDVTDPVNIDSVSLTNITGGYQFAVQTNNLRQFVAFSNRSTFDSAYYIGTVPNQNLHNMPQADVVIVSNPEFMTAAQQLAAFHHNHDSLKVNVVTTRQVYNEFSSGKQDPTAIRDFMRMFYTNAHKVYSRLPKYLVLFGAGSYDPKRRTTNNTNFVVCYEDLEGPSIGDPFDPTASYVSDDFYAVLDSGQGSLANGYSLQLGVGRLPAINSAEAQTLVNKVMSYEIGSGAPANTPYSCCNQQAQYNLSDWRNKICFIAHDGDNGLHEGAPGYLGADQLAQIVNASYPDINVNKIYCDDYQEVQTPGGPRYPEVNTAINDQVDKGCLIMNYTGHGGPLGLAVQRILGFSDILSWNNISALSLFFTASCSFAPFDNPALKSAGQYCVTMSTGGNIALMTTTRETFSGDNYVINESFYQTLFTKLPDSTMPRIGDLFMNAKNIAGPNSQTMFTLLGDPAVRLAYPVKKVYTTTINSMPATGPHDTLKAFSKITIAGYVGDDKGNQDNGFNGVLYPTIYDKPNQLVTDSNPSPTGNLHFHFALQNSILFKGRVSVTNGKFSFTFVVPKDINYKYGNGKISYYGENGTIDGTGSFQNIVVGGSKSGVYVSNKGPQLRLYMNDSNFAYGGMTNQNPQIYAVVFDSNGINTTGNGIGHNITAVLDNNTQNTLDLTSSFQPALNSYQKGVIAYPLSNLSTGTHTLSLRVWNVFNVSTQATTEFNVEPQSDLQLQHVLNYPNPFTTHTQFFYEINQVCDLMDVQIQIFTVSGKIVKNILTTVRTDSFRSPPIDWDGRDDYGAKIANGVYIYHIRVRTNAGQIADTYQKLVIL